MGLERVDQARKRQGWNRQSVSWAEAALTSMACLKQFWRRERIGRETFIRICAAVGVTDWNAIVDVSANFDPAPSEAKPTLTDWGEAPEITYFCGREIELQTLEQWILTDRCKLVMLLGMGGLGKTTLAVRLAEKLELQFERVIWRSLRNAPIPEALMADLLRSLSDSDPIATDPLTRLMQQMRLQRCLLVLDNAESILGTGEAMGRYLPGYEGYGDLLRRLGEERHSSCLILTSREQPRLTVLASDGVRSLHLRGLPQPEAQQILHRAGSPILSAAESAAIVQHYAGNPLALKIVAAGIRDVLGSSVSEFFNLMRQDRFAFADIRDLLERHFARLSAEEQVVMFWLAIAREPVTFDELKADLLLPESRRRLMETLESLKRRSLLEVSPTGFSLQPAVMDFVIQQLIQQVYSEISQGQIDRCRSHALLKATAKDYIRIAQIRLILEPLLERLQAENDTTAIKALLLGLLPLFQGQPALQTGYIAGNVLNLLAHLKVDLSGADFSGLTLWHADLRIAPLHRVNFAHADLARSAVTETFSNVLCVAFSPDGELLAKSDDRGWIGLWQVATGKQLAFQAHSEWSFSVAFSPDGVILSTASLDGSIKLWDAATGEHLGTLSLHTRGVSAIAFSPTDRSLLASSSADQTINLIDWQTGTCRHCLTGHQGIVRAIAWAADGTTIASASLDGTVKLWDATTGNCLHTLATDASVHAVVFVSTTRLASAGSDGHISLWDVTLGNRVAILQGHSSNIWSLAVTPDGAKLISGGDDRTLKIWDLTTGNCLKTLQGHQHRIWSVVAHPKAPTVASGSDDKTVRFWSLSDGQCYRSLQGYHNSIAPIAFWQEERGARLMTFSEDQKVRVWDGKTGECLKTLTLPTKLALQAALSPDRQTIASGSLDCTIWLCDLYGDCLRTLHGHTTWVRFVAFSPNGSFLASAGGDRTIKLWQVVTGACLHTFQGHISPVHCVAFHPHRPILASGSWDRTVRIWDIQTGSCLVTLAHHTDRLTDLLFTPTGNLISSSHDGTICVWDWQKGECLQVLRGHKAGIWAISLSSNGNLLSSTGQDCTVRLWSLNGSHTVLSEDFAGNSLCFSPDDTLLAIGNEDGTCRLWDLKHDRQITLQVHRPYEEMNITRVQGLTSAQIAALKTLGATEEARE